MNAFIILQIFTLISLQAMEPNKEESAFGEKKSSELDLIQNVENDIDGFIKTLPEKKCGKKTIKELYQESLKSMNNEHQQELIKKVQARKTKKKKQDVNMLLMVLNEQLNSSSRDTKRALEYTKQQLISAEKGRIAARRAMLCSLVINCISIPINILQFFGVIES